MLLSILSNFGRKASLIGRQQRDGSDGVSELASFLLTGCGAPPPIAAVDAAAPSSSLAQMRLVLRDAAGTIPVAVCTAPDAACASNASVSLALQRSMADQLRCVQAACADHAVADAGHTVLVESLGAVGDHVAFRHPAVALQWLQRLWALAAAPGADSEPLPGNDDAEGGSCTPSLGSRGGVHVVLHVTMAHVPHELIEGPLLQFLLAVDASFAAFRAQNAATALRRGAGPCDLLLYASVVVEVASPLMASLVQEKLLQCLRASSSPRLVLSTLCVHGGAPSGGKPRADAWQLPPTDGASDRGGASTSSRRHHQKHNCRHSFFAFDHHLPLALFLHDVVSHYGCVLAEDAMELLKASWCAAHDMRDVVSAMHHAVLSPFRYTLAATVHGNGGGQTRAPTEGDTSRERNAAALCLSLRWLSRRAASTFEDEVRCFAALLESVASGSYDTAAAVLDAVGGICGDARGNLEVEAQDHWAQHDTTLRAACARSIELPWATTQRYWLAVGAAALECTPCSGGVENTARWVQKRPRSDTVDLMAPVIAVSSVSVRDALLAAALTRVRHVEESLQEVEGVLRTQPPPPTDTRAALSAGAARTATAGTAAESRTDPGRAKRRSKVAPPPAGTEAHAVAAGAEPPGEEQLLSLNFFHAFVPFSLRVLCVLTHVGVAAKSQKARWVPLERLAVLCCHGDMLQLLHAVRQLRVGKLIAVNGANQEARSLLVAS